MDTQIPQHIKQVNSNVPAPVTQNLLYRIKHSRLLNMALGLSMISVASAAVVFTIITSNFIVSQQQEIGSKAAGKPSSAFFVFNPATIQLNQNQSSQAYLYLKKTSPKKISAVKLQFKYDPAKIENLWLDFEDWVPGKKPEVLMGKFENEPNSTKVITTVVLGAPCDNITCYPWKKANAKFIKMSFVPKGASRIELMDSSEVTMTGQPESVYSHSGSVNLTIGTP